jgi:hypothetical protein
LGHRRGGHADARAYAALRAAIQEKADEDGTLYQFRVVTAAESRFDLGWATDNLVEKRLAQMARVLRDTRARLRVLTPVYDNRVELEVREPRKDTSSPMEAPIFSFTIAMDAAVSFAFSGSARVRMGLSAPETVEIFSYKGKLEDVTQVVAPTVRPVYGDVVAVPAHFRCLYPSGGASGTNTKLVIYAGSEVGEKYALKVGEVDRDQVAGLFAALHGKMGLLLSGALSHERPRRAPPSRAS